jgi:hypothetical protein
VVLVCGSSHLRVPRSVRSVRRVMPGPGETGALP